MFNWAKQEGLVETSPLSTTKPPKEAKHVVKALTAEQLQKVLAAIDGRDFDAIRNKAIILVLADTGVRRGELMSLALENIDLDKQVLNVSGKTGERYVRFGTASAKALGKYLIIKSKVDAHTDACGLLRRGSV